MAFTRSEKTIPVRSQGLAYEELGPGLYEDEALYELDTGDLVALSIKAERNASSQGTVFRAWARVIEPDGQTRVDASGAELETEYPHNVCAADMRESGVSPFARGLILFMLGEQNTLGISDAVWDNVNIREAIKAADAAIGSLDVTALLEGPDDLLLIEGTES